MYMWIGDNCFKKGCLSNNNKIHSFMNSRGENLKATFRNAMYFRAAQNLVFSEKLCSLGETVFGLGHKCTYQGGHAMLIH